MNWTAHAHPWDTQLCPAMARGALVPCCQMGFFENSMLTLAAYEGDLLLGIIRAVGDGHTIVFVQDILVFPEHQRKGIGSALLQAILDRYSHVRQIELATDNTPKTIAFYKSMGFREMSEIGCCGFMRI